MVAEPPPALRRGAALFDAGDFYAAHEAWEEHWLEIGGSERDFYKGLIQAAVALLHWQRGNPLGAVKLRRSAAALLAPFAPTHRGVRVTCFLARLEAHFAPLERALAHKMPAPAPDSATRPRLELEDSTP
ncbi:MAG: DUF309 domain-containing protein [Planctomycetota bacterium]|nr:MAG: DUF309 domain-containing protein [Planctomycetota bacterium]